MDISIDIHIHGKPEKGSVVTVAVAAKNGLYPARLVFNSTKSLQLRRRQA